ncbi:MAG: HAD family hydrolase [Planctomycetota bacterium]
MTIKAVIFDLDGTWVDTLEDNVNCTNASLTTLGVPTRSRDYIRKSVGDGIDTLARRVLPDPDPDQVNALVHLMRAYYQDQLKETAAPYDGIIEMLSQLEAQGIRLSVLSNKPDRMTQSIVKRMFGKISFESVVGQQEGVPLKPDPSGALNIARTMGLKPGDFLYVGDTEVDLKTGSAAGMQTISVTWGFRSADELIESGAGQLADSPIEIVRWIGPSSGDL